jgi:hypothetical protein
MASIWIKWRKLHERARNSGGGMFLGYGGFDP